MFRVSKITVCKHLFLKVPIKLSVLVDSIAYVSKMFMKIFDSDTWYRYFYGRSFIYLADLD